MRYHYRKRDELFVMQEYKQDPYIIADYFARSIYDVIYIENVDGTLSNLINYDAFVDKSKKTPYFEMDSKEDALVIEKKLEDFFIRNPSVSRCPIVCQHRLVGEYTVPDCHGADIQCRYNQFAYAWFIQYINNINNSLSAAGHKKICILIDEEQQRPLWKVLPRGIIEFSMTNNVRCIPTDTDYIINMKYPERLRKALPNGDIQGESLYEVTEAAVFQEMLLFLRENGIRYTFFEGPDKHFLSQLYPDELRALGFQGNASLFLLGNKDYTQKVSKGKIIDVMAPIMFNGLYYTLTDYESAEYNIISGSRKTIGQPSDYSRSVHIFGPCIAQGFLVSDKDTVASQLQIALNSAGHSYRVVNHGIDGMGSLLNSCLTILSTPLEEGDYVIEINTCFERAREYMKREQVSRRELTSIFAGCHYWFFNHPFHCSALANGIIASEIYEQLDKTREILKMKRALRFFSEDVIDKNLAYIASGIQSYIGSIQAQAFSPNIDAHVGAIVMTADPFTEGHLYLVTAALTRVDYLYVFVVQEETGFYSFKERLNMVSIALEHYHNVKVFSTGELMHSVYTFPEYNFRGQQMEKEVDPSTEVKLFGELIAPALHITLRFFGDEPTDAVTRALNACAQKLLPEYGIEVVVFPRKAINGEYISGSKVRSLAQIGNFSELKPLVPDNTLNFLKKKYTEQPDSATLVSLIIPAYNAAKYIRYSLSSACAQGFSSLEIIVVNDGSDDDTATIINEYTLTDRRVLPIHLQSNRGLAVARNIGIRTSIGKYIMFLDSDDQITSDLVQFLYDAAERTRADIAISRFKKVRRLRDAVEPVSDQYSVAERVYTGYEASFDFLNSTLDSQDRPFCSRVMFKLYRRDLIGDQLFREGKAHEDEFFTYKLYRKAARIFYSPVQRYFYLLRDDSLSRRMQSEKEYCDTIEALMERNNYYKEPALRRAACSDYYRYLEFVLPTIKEDFPNSDLYLFISNQLFAAQLERKTQW